MQKPPAWNLPRDLPPCWWIATHQASVGITWNGPFDSPTAAQESWMFKSTEDWFEKPTRVEIVPEDGASFIRRSYSNISSASAVTARWNWFDRHRDVLLGSADARLCSLLISAPCSDSRDLFAHRFGGLAVLPKGHPWPTYTIAKKDSTRYAMIDYSTGEVQTAKKAKYTPFAGFAATIDLRSSFSFGPGFPDAISLFVPLFDPVKNSYERVVDCYIVDGIVMPLHGSEELVEVEMPKVGFALKSRGVLSFPMPDFPCSQVGFGDWVANRDTPERRKTKAIEEEIARREPGSEAWIHLNGPKIGGYESYTQGSVRRILEKNSPEIEWHYIAKWSDDFLWIGDDGQFYILAGYDRPNDKWIWRAMWDCH